MTDVVMPQMGESIVEGTLTKWLKKPGDHVERDEPLFEISTDKVDTEIPSPAAGTLAEMLVEEGKTVGINTVVARIDEGGGGAAGPGSEAGRSAAARRPRSAAQPAPRNRAADARREPGCRAGSRARAGSSGRCRGAGGSALPAGAQDGAREQYRSQPVKGTGAGGRITKQDVEAYMAQAPGAGGAGRNACPGCPPRAAASPRQPRCSGSRRRAAARAGRQRPRRASSRMSPCASRSPSTW